jgi:hypothetical protein
VSYSSPGTTWSIAITAEIPSNMNLDRLTALIEQLRREAIGEPAWIPEKEVFEYQEHSARVVAVLKLVRAMHGVSALELLCANGLFIDAGAIMRCINDCVSEVYFLLEEFPNTSDKVHQFIAAFFASTIDGYLSDDTPPIPTKKARSAVVRVLKGGHDDATRKLLERIFVTFSGYVHASYAHIMEVYNGATSDFNLRGVPSEAQRRMKMQYIGVSAISVLHASAFVAKTLSLTALERELMQLDPS